MPDPSSSRLAVRLTPDALRQVRGGHPWVYADSVRSATPAGRAGDLAVVFDERRRFAAIGLWDPSSPIRIRILHVGSPLPIDLGFWRSRLAACLARREDLTRRGDTTGLRLVNGENDGMPGLVVDRYADVVVLKVYTVAWMTHLDDVVRVIDEAIHPTAVVLRLARALPVDGLRGHADGDVIRGSLSTGLVPFLECGLYFEADVVHGQKTGHFLDQRDNRALVATMVAGRRVLDLFASTGGFTVHAAAGGATEVVSVDLSGPTLEVAARNLAANRHLPRVAACAHTSVVADAFDVLADLGRRGDRFDVVVIDPPSFASRQDQVAGALAAHGRLTALAAAVTSDGGTVVQSSCTSRITVEELERTMRRSAGLAGFELDVRRRTGHPVDHPIGFAEGRYLCSVFATISGGARGTSR
ncbi:MAG: class I SAM-dependent rRNA methyltransferase [Ilumatobacteraceae bacterium]